LLKCIVDSSADLSSETVQALGLVVLPSVINIDDRNYLDGLDLNVEELYALMGTSGHTIKTHHVTPAVYEEAFLPFAQNDDRVICICSASSIAGNYEAARIGVLSVREKYPDFDITVINSKSASCGYGLIAERAGELIQKGLDRDAVLEAVNFYVHHTKHYFIVSMMTYFMKGGKLSHVLGTVSDTFDVHPLFTLDSDGEVENLKPIPLKGAHRAADAILDIMKESGIDFSRQTLAFCYGKEKENLEYFTRKANDMLHPQKITITSAGCTIAAHTGSGFLGIAYFDAVDPF